MKLPQPKSQPLWLTILLIAGAIMFATFLCLCLTSCVTTPKPKPDEVSIDPELAPRTKALQQAPPPSGPASKTITIEWHQSSTSLHYGTVFTVEATTNLRNWIVVGSMVLNTNGPPAWEAWQSFRMTVPATNGMTAYRVGER